MRTKILSGFWAFGLLAAIPALAQSVALPVPTHPAAPVVLEQMLVSGEQPGPGMWKVSKGDNTLWIIGTQTPVPEKMKWRAKGLEAIVAQSQEILTEPSASVSVKQIGYFTALFMLPSALQVRRNPDDATLKEIVPAELHARWLVLRDKYIDAYNINDEEKDIERWRPMFAALELYRKAISKSGLTSSSPVWPVIREAASKHKVKITAIKFEPTIKEPRAALKELRATRLADVDCFAKTIERIESDLVAMRTRANAWATGDVGVIRNLPTVDQRAACEAAVRDASFVKTLGAQNVLAQVEAMWITAAETALRDNKVTLAVLPIARLTSRDGYLSKLRAKGYMVEEPDGLTE